MNDEHHKIQPLGALWQDSKALNRSPMFFDSTQLRPNPLRIEFQTSPSNRSANVDNQKTGFPYI